MSNLIKIVTITICLSLVGCGHGEKYLESSYNKLSSEIAQDLKRYAKFDAEQRREIDQISHELMTWHRNNELPKTQKMLTALIDGLEHQNEISDDLLRSIMKVIADPLPTNGADTALNKMANFAYQLNDQQVQQISMALIDDNKTLAEGLTKWKLDDENKEIGDFLKAMLRDLGLYLNKGQRQKIKQQLKQRQATTPMQIQTEIDWNIEFSHLLQQRLETSQTVFIKQFIVLWKRGETALTEGLAGQQNESHRHNQAVMSQVVKDILAGLNQQDRLNLIKRLGAYNAVIARLISG